MFLHLRQCNPRRGDFLLAIASHVPALADREPRRAGLLHGAKPDPVGAPNPPASAGVGDLLLDSGSSVWQCGGSFLGADQSPHRACGDRRQPPATAGFPVPGWIGTARWKFDRSVCHGPIWPISTCLTSCRIPISWTWSAFACSGARRPSLPRMAGISSSRHWMADCPLRSPDGWQGAEYQWPRRASQELSKHAFLTMSTPTGSRTGS
jgi:hypothetical protein